MQNSVVNRMTGLVSAAAAVFLLTLAAPLPAELIHHWDLDESSGLAAGERNCNGDGELLGFDNLDDSHWVDGVANGGLDLGADGLFDNRVGASFDAMDSTNGGFTICLWVNPGEQILTPGEYQLVATPGDQIGFTIKSNLDMGHDRVLLFWDGSLPDMHVGSTTLEPGTWYHVCITSTGIGGEKLYYIDGELEEQRLYSPAAGGVEGVHPGTRDGWPAGQGFIGGFADGTRGHDSIIDDVRIYNEALDADAIDDILNDVPALTPSIDNVVPADGELAHDASDGFSFDVVARGAGATISEDGIAVTVNGVDVSDQLTISGDATTRQVLYNGLEEAVAYSVQVEVTDSAGGRRCLATSFATSLDVVDGLRHHYRMDETGGLTALDSASLRNGQLVGFSDDDSQWVPGVCDAALDLGAAPAAGYVEVEFDALSAFETGGFTIAMWLNPGEAILGAGEFQLLSTPGDQVGFTIKSNPAMGHERVLLFWDGNLPNLHVGTTTLEPGTWYHVAITSTGSGGEKFYYINGELEEQTLYQPAGGGVEGEHIGTSDGWGPGIARIGAINAGERSHDSIVDDVRVYDRALEEDELLEVLDECDPVLCGPLELEDFTPADGESFHDPSDGIQFAVSTPNTAFSIAPEDVELQLNGVDVSGDLSVQGNGTRRTVLYAGLSANTAYTAALTVTDGCSTLQRTVQFGTFSTCVAEEGLVHHWKMDETSGLGAVDCVGGALGSLVNFENDDDAQWVSGRVGGGLDFGADATNNNYVEASIDSISAGDTGGFTVAMWINPGEEINNPGEYQLFASPGGGVGFTIMNTTNDGGVHDRVLLFWDGSIQNLHVGTTTLEPGSWYHVAITSTGVGGEKIYYIDGQLEEPLLFAPAQGGVQGAHTGNADGWGAGAAAIGGLLGNAGRYHSTIYDDVRIYDRALSDEELDELADVEVVDAIFHRGDADDNGTVQLTDAVAILGYLFLGQEIPSCLDAADSDNNGTLQLTDGVHILQYLFSGGPAPVDPGPSPAPCGPDPALPADTLDCASYTNCN